MSDIHNLFIDHVIKNGPGDVTPPVHDHIQLTYGNVTTNDGGSYTNVSQYYGQEPT